MYKLNLALIIVAIWVAQCYADFPKNEFGWSDKYHFSRNSFDDWSMQKNNYGHQFFGLYHGHGSNWVSSMLNAELVDTITCHLGKMLDELDKEQEKSNKLDDKLFKKIDQELFMLVAWQEEFIQELRYGSAGSCSDALVVIITRQFIITANVGRNKAVAIDSHRVQTISTPSKNPRDLIGLEVNNGVHHPKPKVDIVPRIYKDEKDGSEHEIQFLVLEARPVANSISNNDLSNIVRTGMERLEWFDADSRKIFKDTINTIRSRAAPRFEPADEDSNKDQTVILVKLEQMLD